MSGLNASDTDYINPTINLVVEAHYWIVLIVGVLGNSLTIASVLLNKRLKSIPNVYICSLATADFIVCSVICPYSAYVLTVEEKTSLGHTCVFIGALNIAMLGNTIFNLTAVAFNRFILIVKGSETYTRIYTRRNVIVSLVVLWMLPLLLILPALLGFGQFGYNRKMGTCIFIAYDTMTYIYVQSILHGLCVGPCVIITLYCYIGIIVHFRRAQRRLLSTPPVPSKASDFKATMEEPMEDSKIEDYELSSSGPTNNNKPGTAVHAKKNRASRRVVMNLCTVFSVFLLCWTPIVALFTGDFYNQVPAAVSHFFLAIAVSNSCLNVFIYAGMNRAFRKSYAEILTCKFRKLRAGL